MRVYTALPAPARRRSGRPLNTSSLGALSVSTRPVRKQIVALGGGGFSMEPDVPWLDDYTLGLTGVSRPRVCFIPTASGDAQGYIDRFYSAFPERRAEASHLSLFQRDQTDLREFLLRQHVIYVGGGNTANMLAVWRLHGVDGILKDAWKRGVILTGLSAGMICWFECGVTDSFGPLAALGDGLGLLPGSACPHFDGESQRRPAYHRMIAEGHLADGVAADDGVALHYVGTKLIAAISSRAGRGAYRVSRSAEGAAEVALDCQHLVENVGGAAPNQRLQLTGDARDVL